MSVTTLFYCAAASVLFQAVTAALPSGLYGFDSSQAFVLFHDNGTHTEIGPGANSSEYLLAQGLSTIDPDSATIFAIAYDTKLHVPVLLSTPLATGVASPVLQLPFGEDTDAIGAGQVMSFIPESGLVVVGGVVKSGSTELATVLPNGQNYTAFATLPANVSASLDTSQAVYFPSTQTLVVLVVGVNPPYDRLFAAVSVRTGAVKLLPNGHEPRVDTVDIDPTTGDAFGLGTIGGATDESTRVTVRLAAADLQASVVGVVQGYSDSLGGYSALDTTSHSLYWLGAESGNDDGFYILNIALNHNATVLSAGLACASSLGACPQTFEFYSGTTYRTASVAQ